MPYIGKPRQPAIKPIVEKKKKAPVEQIEKSVSHVASGTDSNLVLSISQTDSSTAVKSAVPKEVVVENTGLIPLVALFVYEGFTDNDTDAGEGAIQTIVMPGEEVQAPIRGAIKEAGSNPLQLLSGTVQDFTTTTIGDGSSTLATLKSDSGDNAASGELNNTDDPVVFELDNGHEKYRVGDMLRCENEILRVEGTYDDNPTASTVADNHIVVSRAHLGSDVASHSGTPDIYFHCFNEYYDYDRVLLGNSQLNMTDSLGRYKSSNFFGFGRTDATADNKTFGLVPGSICFRFYSSAYQEVMMGGTGASGGSSGQNIPITGATDSKLTASTAYAFNLTIDDSSATTVSFTTDSSNTNFGGANGIIPKIQDAIDTATRTAGNALFGYNCSVSIVNGKLRFTSNSHLYPHDETNGSQILLADAGSGTNVFAGDAGIFPDIVMVNAPVKPIIAPVSNYDNITYAKTPNMAGMCYDNGSGDLIYNSRKVGTINYETGAFDIKGGIPSNASFEIQLAHGSPFSGKLDNSQEDSNALKAVHANVLNKNIAGKIKVKVY